MTIVVKVLVIVAIVIVSFFVLSFIVYFFNLDMKMTTSMAPMLQKHYDKRKRNHRI